MQKILSSLFGVDKDRLRVVTHVVGGGFGTKRSSTASTRWCLGGGPASRPAGEMGR